ncbi:hypothetical protein EMIHUDRAFT_252131 [Emiliania huxleyi CCMP1516]|uniref:Uncharacterized protein n=2 Tax=Emiliania huxleyi TaxID=2903 RepID=A0A0D3KNI8_EMIH1|nr:hypothetical protein EMIHUDRAFT_239576 [Emiliania huxleyi CCMP1516]XP_005789752.1 hypothetical protein EMIHUDRAFT_252131 [Emiliania huxleyi CCMP1516]EOD23486.1 hypothetical protein EMIHUDRAFT_239576 [Emiliania huxleyi CCMP1516]EOD37323.1 hypothetical protein EMIHUDRAFT_252131 [Emiliania huxleyi CCMP1516]|eukprot:XP_005775915.1 hypothetical protein EMIHUDRAFT_239576 [Emiliania huxleyi CCMP1516]
MVARALLAVGLATRSNPPTALIPLDQCAVDALGAAARDGLSFEPHFDPRPALGCFASLAPVVLSFHWGTELEAAREAASATKLREEEEYRACLKGEGCPVFYEELKAEAEAAAIRLEEAKGFRLAGASYALLRRHGVPVMQTVVGRRGTAARRGTATMADTASRVGTGSPVFQVGMGLPCLILLPLALLLVAAPVWIDAGAGPIV